MSLLHGLGYSSVRDYAGGIEDWVQRGGPVVDRNSAASVGASGRRGILGRGIDALEAASPGQLVWLGAALVLICAVAYHLSWMSEPDGASFGTALYFSLVTATTLGYGDIVPQGPARVVAVLEAMAGLLLFGALISKFLTQKQDRLVGEIHRLAYQDRLGRVQTNMHLVIRELGSLSELCAADDAEPERLRARLESALLVFATEVRSIHDLLHRPPITPAAEVFEGILAALSAALDTVHQVRQYSTSQSAESDIQESSVRRAVELTLDICSDCIPGGYANDLRPWLDRVQAHAKRL